MFCPTCEAEYRPGITRCPTCEVDLVEDRSADAADASIRSRSQTAEESEVDQDVMVPFCGFVSLEDARHARDQLHDGGVFSEILIRDARDGDPGAGVREEYFLRVPAGRFRTASAILGDDEEVETTPATPGEGLACSECGNAVQEDETFCARCGARFDE